MPRWRAETSNWTTSWGCWNTQDESQKLVLHRETSDDQKSLTMSHLYARQGVLGLSGTNDALWHLRSGIHNPSADTWTRIYEVFILPLFSHKVVFWLPHFQFCKIIKIKSLRTKLEIFVLYIYSQNGSLEFRYKLISRILLQSSIASLFESQKS